MANNVSDQSNQSTLYKSNDLFPLNEIFDIITKNSDLYTKKGFNLKNFLENLERQLLIQVLNSFEGNPKKTSEFLDIKRTTMYAKCKKFNIKFVKTVF